ncbi:MAG: hypothetical protein ABH879_02950 [archaeon]
MRIEARRSVDLEELAAEAERISRQQRYLEAHWDDPGYAVFLEYVFRHTLERKSDAVVELGSGSTGSFDRLRRSLHMDSPAQFANMARVAWILTSLSGGRKDTGLYELYKISGLGQTLSLDQLTPVESLGICSYECPGLAETIAGFKGYETLFALATGTPLQLMLYGKHGAERNRHLIGLSPEEQDLLQSNRAALMGLLNIPVTSIDIPEGFLRDIPEPVALARGMLEYDYAESRFLDDSFVRHLRSTRPGKSIRSRDNPWDILASCKGPSGEEYGQMMGRLKDFLFKEGMALLHDEGVYASSDFILRADDYRDPKFRHTDSASKRACERRASIWRNLMPSDLTALIKRQLTDVIRPFPNMEYDQQRVCVEYFTGEVIDIIGQLLLEPTRALFKFGNRSEQPWDETVLCILGDRTLADDASLLLGEYLPPGYSFERHAPFIPIHYQHFTFRHREGGHRDKQISYGPSRSDVLFWADQPDVLLQKLRHMGDYDPDQLARLVVGAGYSLMNTGDVSDPIQWRRMQANGSVLSEACGNLPDAYLTSFSAMVPLGIPDIIDKKIAATGSAKPDGSCLGQASAIVEQIGITHRDIREDYESHRTVALEKIRTAIEGLDISRGRAIGVAEGALSSRYHTRYARQAESLTGNRADVAAQKLDLLADIYLGLYCIPPDERDPDSNAMLSTLLILNTGFYDLARDSLRGSAEHEASIAYKAMNTMQHALAMEEKRCTNHLPASSPQGTKQTDNRFEVNLDCVAQSVIQCAVSRDKLENLVARAEDPLLQETRQRIETVIGYIDAASDCAVSWLVGVVDPPDLRNYLNRRFSGESPLCEHIVEVMRACEKPGQLVQAINTLISAYAPKKERQRLLETRQSYVEQGEFGLWTLIYDIGLLNTSTIARQPKETLFERYRESPTETVYHAMEALAAKSLHTSEEAVLLRRVEAKLAEAEDRYLSDPPPDRAGVLMPHELQQHAAWRNQIATQIRFYSDFERYIAGKGPPPESPEEVTRTSESAFVIRPDQAAGFFQVLGNYLKRELGDSLFSDQLRRLLPEDYIAHPQPTMPGVRLSVF